MYSDEELLKRLKKINWDTPIPEAELLKMLKGEPSRDFEAYRKSLYIKIVNGFSWHQVRKMITEDKLPSVLTDEVIQGLFPRNLREKYRYVQSLL